MERDTDVDPRWINLGSFNDLEDEDVVRVRMESREYAVYRCGGKLHVTDGRCTHKGALLSEGVVIGDIIECPLHQGRFHIPSGRIAGGPVCKDLNSYPTKIVDEALFILIPN